MKRTRSHLRNHKRRGAVAVFTAVMLMVLFGMASLTIDVGHLYNMHLETQNLADAACLAGATAISDDEQGDYHARAMEIVAINQKAFNYEAPEDQIIQIGMWSVVKGKGGTFVALDEADWGKANAVRAVGVRNDVPFFFATIFGTSSTNVSREAVALASPPCGGIWGLENVNVPGNPSTDSYNSTEGPYSSLTAYSNGDICSGGSLTVSGSTDIDGQVSASDIIRLNGSALTISGSITELTAVVDSTLPDFGEVSMINDNDTIGLTDEGEEPLSDLDFRIGSDDNLTLAPGVYYFTEADFGAHATLTLTGKTTIYLVGSFNASGGGTINTTTDPGDLMIISSGTEVEITGDTEFYGSIFAPNADVKLTGSGSFYGAIIGKTVDMRGTFDFHADESSPLYDLVDVPPPLLVK